jgi:hypothetical protein
VAVGCFSIRTTYDQFFFFLKRNQFGVGDGRRSEAMFEVKLAEVAAEDVQPAAIPPSGKKTGFGIVSVCAWAPDVRGQFRAGQISIAEQLVEGGRRARYSGI